MDAAERNYKDPNHKPELVFALTPFLAMNAFREFSDIVALLQPSPPHIRLLRISWKSRVQNV